MSPPLLLGIDGGGTTTTAWLADADGHVLGRGRSGPSNVKAIGPDAAREALSRAIADAFSKAGLPPAPAEVACLGLAGYDRPEDRALLEQWSGAAGWARRLVLVTDGDLVLAAGTPDGHGAAVIAGTGSIAVGRAPDGRSARAGGWGYLFGDEGSAFAVAVAGLRLVARRADGRDALRVLKAKSPAGDGKARRDPLTDHLCRALGVSRPEEVVTAVYAGGFDRTRIAALAPAVVAAAEDDPEVTSWVLEPAGYELGQAVRAVALAIDWRERVLPLAMAGGFLLATPPVAEALLAYLRKFVAHEIVTTPVPEPALGAITLARRALQP
jgi:N-acetylglucosamine kinase-like BadF-type ATPase